MTITYRTVGTWGAGKGSNLTAAEIDGNFYDLDQRIADLVANPPEAIGIDHFVVDGTMLTIVMTDGSEHGPFVLPVAQWRWTGDWLPDVTYFVGDIVEHDSSIYFVRVQHVSAATFDPALFTVDGFVYILILAKPAQPYDLGLFYNDLIGSGDEILFQHVAVRASTVPANFENAQAHLRIATTDAEITIPIYINNEIVGTITFSPGVETDGMGGQFGTFAAVTPDVAIEIAVRDIVAIAQPYEVDSAAAGLAITLAAVVPSL